MIKSLTMPDELLKRFLEDVLPPFDELKEVGFYTEDMRNDYKAQAKRVCDRFGLKSVYEYGAIETRCHITYGDEISGLESNCRPMRVDDEGLKPEPFITVIPSIYD